MQGITGYASYVPYHYLDLAEAAETLAGRPLKGSRAVASYDEDATTMAVEAGRRLPDRGRHLLILATTSPPYHDKSNATAVHAALGMPADGHATDVAASPRAGMSAIFLAARTGGMAVLSDVRTGLPGSEDESRSGDAAAAFTFGDDEPIAVFRGGASVTEEFLDRWRVPGQQTSHVWEERFGAQLYIPLMSGVATRVIDELGTVPDHVIVSSPHGRAAATVARNFREHLAVTTAGTIGYAGAADVGIQLAAVLDVAQPGETVLIISGADGADALVLETTEHLVQRRAPVTVATQIEARRRVPYPLYLTWREQLRRQPPRRPDPAPYAAPPAAREQEWKYGFVASRCTNCGKTHMPPQRVCMECQAVDQMEPRPMADVAGRVATFTVDHLAYSLSPPTVAAVVDFEGGGRFECEMTDEDPDEVRVGDPVQMTFRKRYTARGVHNYFWKAAPARFSNEA